MDKQTEFLMIVQTGLLNNRINDPGYLVGKTLFGFCEAVFIPIDAIPDDRLARINMAVEYVNWKADRHDEMKQPQWLLDEWLPEDW